jgi:hypothetical protein
LREINQLAEGFFTRHRDVRHAPGADIQAWAINVRVRPFRKASDPAR